MSKSQDKKATGAISKLLFKLFNKKTPNRVEEKISKGISQFLGSIDRKKLKIALISFYYQKPTTSGVGTHVQNLAKFLVKNNCEVHVFCQGYEEEISREEGVIVHSIPKVLNFTGDNDSDKRLEYDLFESEVVKEILRENSNKKFDIIHTHGSLTKAAFLLKKVCKVKWIHTFHAIETLRIKKLSKKEKNFEDLISWIEHTVNYSDGAIFVSKTLLKDNKGIYKLKSKIVIPNGVDLELFKPSSIENKNVLFVGRFSKDKGIAFFPKLIPQIMAIKDATFTAVCPHKFELTGEMKKIRDKIQELENQYKGRLKIITRPVDQKALKELYKDCQVYIQPSAYESFGLCILEAMATGRPVVAFKVGGIPEVLGKAGFAIKSKKRFVNKIKELLENKKECEKIGKKSIKRAKLFDWNLIAKNTIKYYEKIKNE